MPMRLGIFGGTFDPPHIGHLVLAAEALEQLRLDRLLWVLTPNPPHKPGQYISPLSIRLKLVNAAIESNPAFELSRIDIERPAPHYAVDTVRLLGAQFPGAELVYLIGGDSLRDMPGWHDPRGLSAAVSTFGVMRRPDARISLTRLERLIPGLSEKIVFIDTPRMDVSSSLVRQRIAEGRTYRYYLPENIYQLIEQQHLYQTNIL